MGGTDIGRDISDGESQCLDIPVAQLRRHGGSFHQFIGADRGEGLTAGALAAVLFIQGVVRRFL